MFTGINARLGILAVVAIAAIGLGILFSKIMEQKLSTAARGNGIGTGVEQQLPPNFLLRNGFARQEFVHFIEVLLGIEGHASALASVAPSPPGLLVVSLEAPGHVMVHDQPHVGFVDAHSEGHRSYNNVNLFV